MKKQGIYCIEHVASGKKYIGSSMNISRRFTRHRSELNHNKHHCVYLQRAVNKYGIASFKFHILKETNFATVDELQSLEKIYLDNGTELYNVGAVGGGDNLSNHPDKEDIIRRRTETILKNLELLTEEERAKRFEHTKGESNGNWKNGISTKICPVCQSVKIAGGAKTCMGCQTYDRKGEKNSFYGKKHSEETLAILRNNESWVKGLKPEEIPYTKQYMITYPDGTTKTVYGLKAISIEFGCSIANVDLTIGRMKRGSVPTKRSVFYQHLIKEIEV
jgi:group I intron endonuclease